MSQYPEAHFIKSANALSQFVPDDGVEVAVAGRSNAGKSSAINVIVNRRQFARTSKTPGRTQLVNFFSLRDGPFYRGVGLKWIGSRKFLETNLKLKSDIFVVAIWISDRHKYPILMMWK